MVRQVVQNENDRERDRLSEYGTVVLTSDNRRTRMESDFSETAFINALIRLQSDKKHQLCWSIGHGERSFEDSVRPSEMGLVADRLKDQNFDIREIRVYPQGVPSDCDLVVIAGPQTDWMPEERDALASYIAHGGRALVLLDPIIQGVNVDGFAGDLAEYGIVVGNDFVMDADPQHFRASGDMEALQIYFGSNFSVHPIMSLRNGQIGIELARSVKWFGTDSGALEGRTLIEASAMSWAETTMEYEGNQRPAPDESEEVGRIGFAALAEVKHPRRIDDTAPDDARGRIVVFGDSDFASNRLSGLWHNGDLFLNAASWLVGEEEQMGERESGEAEFLIATHSNNGHSRSSLRCWLYPALRLLRVCLCFSAGVSNKKRDQRVGRVF